MEKRYIVKILVEVPIFADNEADAEDKATEIIERDTGRCAVIYDTEQR